MTDLVKATRATVKLGTLTIDGFMLPNGEYRMSQTQAAEIIQLTERNAREFLDSKTFKRLTGEAYTPAIFEIEAGDQQRGQSRHIRGWGIPICHLSRQRSAALPNIPLSHLNSGTSAANRRRSK
jgi:hypothetical protein